MGNNFLFIILKSIKYKENSFIINGYSQLTGLDSYILKTTEAKRKTSGLSYIYPLSIIEITPSTKNYGTVKSIKEISPHIRNTQIRINLKKSSIAFFISELILKTIKDTGIDSSLFEFLYSKIVELEKESQISPDFHLFFTLEYISYLGYQIPEQIDNNCDFFDISKGSFVNCRDESGLILDKESSDVIRNSLLCKDKYITKITQNRGQRINFINNMIKFISYHSQEKIKIESLNILHQVFE